MDASGDEASLFFVQNIATAEFAGEIYWRGDDGTQTVSIEAPLVMVNNSAPTAGAIYLSGSRLHVFIDGAHFHSNMASKNGRAMVTYLVGQRDEHGVVQGCTFQGNTAGENSGALVVSAGFVGTRESIFEYNLVGECSLMGVNFLRIPSQF